ncbi:thermonuclease family protein [Phaeovibrio sulfidiphilus]|uniref:Thermonuclease family protein n=1 Tax=Phaeovibrio sulfidiphilus TaxID=1220600 RepID=A0A8J7CD17_9PROT|nr:thermonuclease family protein [Phaeovibrio sulfidiphilus]MBE1236544.1 thermonuclease family protein [Phaeovibrio sulfidiphilus]
MYRMFVLIFCLGLVCAGLVRSGPAGAAADGADALSRVRDPAELPSIGRHRVTDVVDGDTVVLDTGREVRLVGIQAPKLPLGRKGFAEWPLAPESRQALVDLVDGRTVTLHAGGATEDRHGRILAHLVTDDGVWIQGEMISRGLARVYTFPDNRALTEALYGREADARAARAGIWALDWYAVRPPARLDSEIGTFQVVEGTVVSAARAGRTVYLNFGRDWRRDFTVSIPERLLERFSALGRDPLAWTGKTVRVRGWLREKNGPWIEVTHPEMIEGPITDP